MKVAIVGCGTIAHSAHIPAYLKNEKVEIKYFCDHRPARAQAAVEKYGCGIAVTDYRDILRDEEVQAVSVCTPNDVHAPITIDFPRWQACLMRKPAARTRRALQMQQAQHASGDPILAYNRFKPA